MKKNEQTQRNMGYICVMRIPSGEDKRGQKNVFEEIMAESFLNLMKAIHLHNQEAQQIPNDDHNRFMPRYITLKELQAARECDS